MRFITRLAYETEKLLERIEEQSKYYQVRNRAKCIRLSYHNYQISQIIEILTVSRNTIYNWLNNWEKYGLIGLYNLPGRGRKAKLTSQEEEQVKKWIKEEPKNLKMVQEKINEESNIRISKDTIKRIAKKKNGLVSHQKKGKRRNRPRIIPTKKSRIKGIRES